MNSPRRTYATGMVFGVFDAFHKGHEYLLAQAKGRCESLVVVVTLPEVVELIKKKRPKDTLEKRMENIRRFDQGFAVVAGDGTLGEWSVLGLHKPDVVLLGYDQQGIARELDALGMAYVFIDAHHPEKYKSSLVSGRPAA